MKLVTFTHSNHTRVGALVDDNVVDCLANPAIPTEMKAFLSHGEKAHLAMQHLLEKAEIVFH